MNQITVRTFKYDGSEHREWLARVVRQDKSLLVLDAEFAEEIEHELLGRISRGTLSIEYYWLNHWYNIFRFAEPNGKLRNYYCNINVPPSFDGQELRYVDLDIDVLVNPDFSYTVLDREEFKVNAVRYGYPAEIVANTERGLEELIQLIETRSFPFNEDSISE